MQCLPTITTPKVLIYICFYEVRFVMNFYLILTGPCSAWNLSLHEYSEPSPERLGAHLYTFCSRDGYKNYSLPWKLNIVVIK